MAQINQDFRHHLVNGLCGVRASEQLLKTGKLTSEEQIAEAKNLDTQLKRIFEALEILENKEE